MMKKFIRKPIVVEAILFNRTQEGVSKRPSNLIIGKV